MLPNSLYVKIASTVNRFSSGWPFRAFDLGLFATDDTDFTDAKNGFTLRKPPLFDKSHAALC
jgi:hypothetical protein